MAAHEKSEGFLQYERDIAAIQARISNGDLSDDTEIMFEVTEAMIRNAPRMNDNEREVIAARSLALHGTICRALAKDFGTPVPGNDPEKPN
jgi:hypothetical protein